MTRTSSNVIHWMTTVIFVAFLSWSAVLYLTESPRMMETMGHLGYPLYFSKGLGVAKLLGCAALLFGRGRLKEWAYAGFTFDLIGAAVSHLASGDGPIASVPLAFLALLAVSYVTERRQYVILAPAKITLPSFRHAG